MTTDRPALGAIRGEAERASGMTWRERLDARADEAAIRTATRRRALAAIAEADDRIRRGDDPVVVLARLAERAS